MDAIFDYPNNESSEKTDTDSKSDDNDENFSTLRELLIRPHPGPKSSISNKNCVSRKAVSSATTLDDVINCVIEQNIKKASDGRFVDSAPPTFSINLQPYSNPKQTFCTHLFSQQRSQGGNAADPLHAEISAVP